MNKFFTMLKTELKLSFRGMDMVIFALCMPVVVALILGVIYGAKTAAPEVKYTFLEQSFGALSAIAICAGSVMGLPLLISDYRQKKILKRYKVTPAGPAFLLAVWVTIYAVYSLLSLGLVFGVFIHIFWMQVQRIGRDFPAHVSSGDVFDVQHRTYGGRCCA